MSIMGMISKAKEKFHQRQMDVVQHKTAKIREQNLKDAELTQAKQELREAQQIREDLRADRMQQIEKGPPSKLATIGKNMARTIKEHKAKVEKRGGGLRIGAPQSTGSRGLELGVRGDPFGGTRNLDVGGGSPFSKSGGGLSFGRQEPPKERPKVTVIKIQQ
jgi:hypothetical protein